MAMALPPVILILLFCVEKLNLKDIFYIDEK